MANCCRHLALTCCLATFAVLFAGVEAQAAPIRGFPDDALAEHVRRERLLRAAPDTALLHEYVRTMSEDPHHAGSPGPRAAAEYVLEKYTSW